jgi:hypothetical protein
MSRTCVVGEQRRQRREKDRIDQYECTNK